MNDFTHLHVHSEYSLLDGYATTKAIAERAAELGMDSIAITDHGVMYGAIEFYESAKKAGIKPIIGMEAYVAPGSRTQAAKRGSKSAYHLLMLAKDEVGYRNLTKLTTLAHLEGFSGRGVFARPRIDRELLEQYHEGLVLTSSCIAGEVIQHLMQSQKDQAREIAAWYRDLLGPDNYYLELQLHGNTPELEEINDELVRIGKELKIPLVATNDTHFVRSEDLEAHKMIMAMGFNMTLQELCSKNYDMDETYHIMSGEEMWQRFKKYGVEPLENTRRIADMCNLNLEFGRVELPAFEIPEGHNASSYLKFVCEEGLMKRCNGEPPEGYFQRLEYELDVINQTGFPDYMLIVWDYVRYARERNIPCLPRGSAGASLVLYCLGVTDVDPIANKLLFERFLSPERLEMPDVDTDFADSRRHEILEYIAHKYGRENTAQIITYGTLGAKAALRDVGRTLNLPLPDVDRVAKLIPTLPVGTNIAQALERVPELKQIYDNNADMQNLINWAQKVEGRMKNVGTHACGLVVSRNPLDRVVPLQRTTKDENAVMASYEGPTLAKIGLLKMDILGLTNLSIVAEALNYIEETTGTRFELADIPLQDTKTFESLGRGETTNVFQFESTGMTRYLTQLKPTRVGDLYAMVALYRPGPLEQIPVYIHNKNNPQDIKYLHPILEPILADTYGVIVYQEQIMQLLQAIAGYTLGQAYIVLKAIGKKKRDLMAAEEPRFKDGCIKNGLTRDQADTLWDLIQPFAGYSFNRPHSTLYGLLSYQTAYLKVNYPTQYMTAVLSASAGEIEAVTKSVNECGRLGVAVMPVDINCSSIGFTVEDVPEGQLPEYENRKAIRFGLSAIRNVGEGPLHVILKAREEGGPFQSLEDFCDRVERSALNKRVLESLIKCGALDGMPGTRRQKLAILEQALSAGIEAQRAREAGQSSMFDLLGGSDDSANASVQAIPLPVIKEEPDHYKEQLAWEKELLGMYVSDHPMTRALEQVDMSQVTPISLAADLVGHSNGKDDKHTFVGMLSGVRRLMTKKGDSMAVATLEDLESSIEVVAFPKTFEKYQDLFQDDALIRVTAKVDTGRSGDMLQLMLETIEPLESATQKDNEATAAMSMDLDGVTDSVPDDVVPHPTLPTNDTPTPTNGTHSAQPTNGSEQGSSAAPVNVIRSRVKVAAHANGNGHENGNGHSEPAPVASKNTLRLYFHRSDNFDTDIRRMQEIDQVLRQYEGDDDVVIHVPNGVGIVLLKTHVGVRCNDTLVGSLAQMLGDDRVIVE